MSAELLLAQWVIYNNPRDYPGKFVARKWEIRRGLADPIPTPEVIVSDCIVELRKQIPRGLFRLARLPGDDPKIVEVWT